MTLMMKKNKKGSVTVFVCIFFVSLVTLIFAFSGAAKKAAVSSSADALCGLWADSILAEYDLNLQKRYNLFGFYGYPQDVRKKMDFYAKKSFRRKKYIKYGGSNCSLYDYSLINTGIFKKQVVKAGQFAFTKDFIAPNPDIQGVDDADNADNADNAGTADNVDNADNAGTTDGGKHQVEEIYQELPSGGTTKSFSIASAVSGLRNTESIKELVKSAGDRYFITKYIQTYFKSKAGGEELGKTWLENEREYIICGKQSDSDNASSVKWRIEAVREVINLVFLHTDPKMRGEAMAAAEILTPGPPALITCEALLAGWALAESHNDYKLLIAGHRVPLMKTQQTWAIDLESVINNTEEGCVFTGIDEGESYTDYLDAFTLFIDENVCLLRMMDLIQMNMKYLYYDSFLLKEYNGGVCVSIKVNGEKHETAKKY